MAVYIYGLVDSLDNQIHYVGQTINLDNRMRSHMTFTDRESRKVEWLQGLIAAGGSASFVVLEQVETNAEADIAEQTWILNGIRAGWPLTNNQFMTITTPRASRASFEKDAGKKAAKEKIAEYITEGRSRPEIIQLLCGKDRGGTYTIIGHLVDDVATEMGHKFTSKRGEWMRKLVEAQHN